MKKILSSFSPLTNSSTDNSLLASSSSKEKLFLAPDSVSKRAKEELVGEIIDEGVFYSQKGHFFITCDPNMTTKRIPNFHNLRSPMPLSQEETHKKFFKEKSGAYIGEEGEKWKFCVLGSSICDQFEKNERVQAREKMKKLRSEIKHYLLTFRGKSEDPLLGYLKLNVKAKNANFLFFPHDSLPLDFREKVLRN